MLEVVLERRDSVEASLRAREEKVVRARLVPSVSPRRTLGWIGWSENEGGGGMTGSWPGGGCCGREAATEGMVMNAAAALVRAMAMRFIWEG